MFCDDLYKLCKIFKGQFTLNYLSAAVGHIGELVDKLLAKVFLDQQRKPDICTEIGVESFHLKFGENVAYLSVKIVVGGYGKGIAAAHYHDIRSVHGNFCTVGVGTDKSAAAEKYSAEIACHNAADIGELFLLQDVQNGNARSALRLAVVGVSGSIALTQDIGVNVMSCLAVFCPYLIDKVHSFVVCVNGLDIADKFGALFDKGIFGVCTYGLVV